MIDINEILQELADAINTISRERDRAEMLARDYAGDLNSVIAKIKYYKKHCCHDGVTIIGDKELDELLDILKG